jgi:hypothetical protein
VVEGVDLAAEVVLALTDDFKLLLADFAAFGIEGFCVDASFQSSGVGLANAGAEIHGQAAFQHLREAAEFFADGFRLPNEGAKHAVLGTLGINEVVAIDHRRRLELSVDTAVSLLQTAGIPRHIEVEEVMAVSL